MEVQILKLKESAVIPEYATEHAAAMDICAAIDEPITLGPLERTLIPSGFAVALPEGTEMQIRARSGLSLKHGITMANGVGTIDADYRGEVGVIMVNISNEPFTIEPGMRVAQALIARYEKVTWKTVDALNETTRGKGGYGSTGV